MPDSSSRKLKPVEDQPETVVEPEAAEVQKLVPRVVPAVPAKEPTASTVEEGGKRLRVKTARTPVQRYVRLDRLAFNLAFYRSTNKF